jgi:hypothetical protein
MKKHIRSALLSLAVIATFPAFAQDVPAPGVSPRIDAIRKAGVLRVGVLDFVGAVPLVAVRLAVCVAAGLGAVRCVGVLVRVAVTVPVVVCVAVPV